MTRLYFQGMWGKLSYGFHKKNGGIRNHLAVKTAKTFKKTSSHSLDEIRTLFLPMSEVWKIGLASLTAVHLYSSEMNRLAASTAYPPIDTITQLLLYSPRIQHVHGMFPKGNLQRAKALLAMFEQSAQQSAYLQQNWLESSPSCPSLIKLRT